jgi:hypothetical protein
MKKCLYVICMILFSGSMSFAAPGDTTWVQANVFQLGYYGNYDSTVTFPTGGTYRNVYMIFTLGKYVCPGSPQYCGDWDYTVQNFLMTPDGDTLELGRLITPYANSGAPRTPNSWTQRYVFDVTDYAAKLQGPATIRLHYSGYSGGFTSNIRFAFVEGTPDRTVTGIRRLWHGSFGYGGATNINTKFLPVSQNAPNGTESAELKFNITGHGSDDAGCCEFLSKDYKVMLNSAPVATKTIWRDDCGSNELSPQSGTWLFDRANWCPGALVRSNFHPLPGITGGSAFDVALRFDPYVSPGGGLGSYTTETHLIYYGPMNKLRDASIEDVIAPTDNENHFRENPVCENPVITVKNRGAGFINLITFEYGVKDSGMQTYTWSGALNSMEYADITLPALTSLHTAAGGTMTATFVAKIKAVNGTRDADTTNDIMTTTFKPAPLWDGQFRIQFTPNNQLAAGVSETYWKIYNDQNEVVKSRTNATINTLYIDTVTLPTGCYRLELTDGGCDGLHWWLYDNNTSLGVNRGSFFVKKYSTAANIPLNGYTYSGTYSHDFGCKFVQSFYTSTPVSGVTDIKPTFAAIEAYPNPAKDVVFVDFNGLTNVNGGIHILDAVGRVVKSINVVSAHQEISTSGLSTGAYTILYVDDNGNKLQTKLLIAK